MTSILRTLLTAAAIAAGSSAAFAAASNMPTQYQPDPALKTASISELQARVRQACSVTQALIQAERYGTPLGTALRTMAQENRDIRMNEAEKKAAALPPKLTVPMILFFLPVLIAVILGPAGIQVSDKF